MNLQMFIMQVLNGVHLGSFFFLLASGLTLIFGFMDIMNLAHGSFFMLAGYVTLSVVHKTGSFILGWLAGIATVLVLGIFIERGLLRGLYGRHMEQILLTFGVVFIFNDIISIIWGPKPTILSTPDFFTGSVPMLGFRYPVFRFAIIAIGALTALGLWFFQEKTIWGARVRAGVDDKEMAQGLGTNVSALFTLVFGIGIMLAGLSGVLGASITGLHLGLSMEILVPTLAVTIIGGMGSIRGALLASLLFGLSDTFGRIFLKDFAMAIIYVVMIVVLIVKPSGLFGKS